MPPSLADAQAAFAAAVADPSVPIPPNLLGGGTVPDPLRFAVYRNNVAVSLTEALRGRFPVVARLVGDDFFAAIARAFVAAHPPRSPLLFRYGDDLPAFVEAFAPAAAVPYLADMARLEIAWSRAYHAAEAEPLDVAALASVPPEDLAEVRLRLHPSVGLVRATHPVVGIWAAHQSADAPRPPEIWEAEDALVVRPDAEVHVHCLPPGGYAFAEAVLAGLTLGEAAAAADTSADGFDFGRGLVGLFQCGAVAGIDRPQGTSP